MSIRQNIMDGDGDGVTMEKDGRTLFSDRSDTSDEIILSRFTDDSNVKRFLPRVRLTCIRNVLTSAAEKACAESQSSVVKNISYSIHTQPTDCGHSNRNDRRCLTNTNTMELGQEEKKSKDITETFKDNTVWSEPVRGSDGIESDGSDSQQPIEKRLKTVFRSKKFVKPEDRLLSITYKWSKLRKSTVDRTVCETLEAVKPLKVLFKRKPGRPCKNAMHFVHEPRQSSIVFDHPVKQLAPPLKRKRGRPQKNKRISNLITTQRVCVDDEPKESCSISRQTCQPSRQKFKKIAMGAVNPAKPDGGDLYLGQTQASGLSPSLPHNCVANTRSDSSIPRDCTTGNSTSVQYAERNLGEREVALQESKKIEEDKLNPTSPLMREDTTSDNKTHCVNRKRKRKRRKDKLKNRLNQSHKEEFSNQLKNSKASSEFLVPHLIDQSEMPMPVAKENAVEAGKCVFHLPDSSHVETSHVPVEGAIMRKMKRRRTSKQVSSHLMSQEFILPRKQIHKATIVIPADSSTGLPKRKRGRPAKQAKKIAHKIPPANPSQGDPRSVTNLSHRDGALNKHGNKNLGTKNDPVCSVTNAYPTTELHNKLASDIADDRSHIACLTPPRSNECCLQQSDEESLCRRNDNSLDSTSLISRNVDPSSSSLKNGAVDKKEKDGESFTMKCVSSHSSDDVPLCLNTNILKVVDGGMTPVSSLSDSNNRDTSSEVVAEEGLLVSSTSSTLMDSDEPSSIRIIKTVTLSRAAVSNSMMYAITKPSFDHKSHACSTCVSDVCDSNVFESNPQNPRRERANIFQALSVGLHSKVEDQEGRNCNHVRAVKSQLGKQCATLSQCELSVQVRGKECPGEGLTDADIPQLVAYGDSDLSPVSGNSDSLPILVKEDFHETSLDDDYEFKCKTMSRKDLILKQRVSRSPSLESNVDSGRENVVCSIVRELKDKSCIVTVKHVTRLHDNGTNKEKIVDAGHKKDNLRINEPCEFEVPANFECSKEVEVGDIPNEKVQNAIKNHKVVTQGNDCNDPSELNHIALSCGVPITQSPDKQTRDSQHVNIYHEIGVSPVVSDSPEASICPEVNVRSDRSLYPDVISAECGVTPEVGLSESVSRGMGVSTEHDVSSEADESHEVSISPEVEISPDVRISQEVDFPKVSVTPGNCRDLFLYIHSNSCDEPGGSLETCHKSTAQVKSHVSPSHNYQKHPNDDRLSYESTEMSFGENLVHASETTGIDHLRIIELHETTNEFQSSEFSQCNQQCTEVGDCESYGERSGESIVSDASLPNAMSHGRADDTPSEQPPRARHEAQQEVRLHDSKFRMNSAMKGAECHDQLTEATTDVVQHRRTTSRTEHDRQEIELDFSGVPTIDKGHDKETTANSMLAIHQEELCTSIEQSTHGIRGNPSARQVFLQQDSIDKEHVQEKGDIEKSRISSQVQETLDVFGHLQGKDEQYRNAAGIRHTQISDCSALDLLSLVCEETVKYRDDDNMSTISSENATMPYPCSDSEESQTHVAHVDINTNQTLFDGSCTVDDNAQSLSKTETCEELDSSKIEHTTSKQRSVKLPRRRKRRKVNPYTRTKKRNRSPDHAHIKRKTAKANSCQQNAFLDVAEAGTIKSKEEACNDCVAVSNNQCAPVLACLDDVDAEVNEISMKKTKDVSPESVICEVEMHQSQFSPSTIQPVTSECGDNDMSHESPEEDIIFIKEVRQRVLDDVAGENANNDLTLNEETSQNVTCANINNNGNTDGYDEEDTSVKTLEEGLVQPSQTNDTSRETPGEEIMFVKEGRQAMVDDVTEESVNNDLELNEETSGNNNNNSKTIGYEEEGLIEMSQMTCDIASPDHLSETNQRFTTNNRQVSDVDATSRHSVNTASKQLGDASLSSANIQRCGGEDSAENKGEVVDLTSDVPFSTNSEEQNMFARSEELVSNENGSSSTTSSQQMTNENLTDISDVPATSQVQYNIPKPDRPQITDVTTFFGRHKQGQRQPIFMPGMINLPGSVARGLTLPMSQHMKHAVFQVGRPLSKQFMSYDTPLTECSELREHLLKGKITGSNSQAHPYQQGCHDVSFGTVGPQMEHRRTISEDTRGLDRCKEIAQNQLYALRRDSMQRRKNAEHGVIQSTPRQLLQARQHHPQSQPQFYISPFQTHPGELGTNLHLNKGNVTRISPHVEYNNTAHGKAPSAFVRTANGTVNVSLPDECVPVSQVSSSREGFMQQGQTGTGVSESPWPSVCPRKENTLDALMKMSRGQSELPINPPVITARVPQNCGLKEHVIAVYQDRCIPLVETDAQCQFASEQIHKSNVSPMSFNPLSGALKNNIDRDSALELLRKLHSSNNKYQRQMILKQLSIRQDMSGPQTEDMHVAQPSCAQVPLGYTTAGKTDTFSLKENSSLSRPIPLSSAGRTQSIQRDATLRNDFSNIPHQTPTHHILAHRSSIPRTSSSTIDSGISSQSPRTPTPRSSGTPSVTPCMSEEGGLCTPCVSQSCSPGTSAAHNDSSHPHEKPLDLTYKGNPKDKLLEPGLTDVAPLDLSCKGRRNEDGRPNHQGQFLMKDLPTDGTIDVDKIFLQRRSENPVTQMANGSSTRHMSDAPHFCATCPQGVNFATRGQPADSLHTGQSPVGNSTNDDSKAGTKRHHQYWNNDQQNSHPSQTVFPRNNSESWHNEHAVPTLEKSDICADIGQQSSSKSQVYCDKVEIPFAYMDLSMRGLTSEVPGLPITKRRNSYLDANTSESTSLCTPVESTLYLASSKLSSVAEIIHDASEEGEDNQKISQQQNKDHIQLTEEASMEIVDTRDNILSSSDETGELVLRKIQAHDGDSQPLDAQIGESPEQVESNAQPSRKTESTINTSPSSSVINHCPKKRYKLALEACLATKPSIEGNRTLGASEAIKEIISKTQPDDSTYPIPSPQSRCQAANPVEQRKRVGPAVVRRKRGRPRVRRNNSAMEGAEFVDRTLVAQQCQFCEFKSMSRQATRIHVKEMHFAKHITNAKLSRTIKHSQNDNHISCHSNVMQVETVKFHMGADTRDIDSHRQNKPISSASQSRCTSTTTASCTADTHECGDHFNAEQISKQSQFDQRNSNMVAIKRAEVQTRGESCVNDVSVNCRHCQCTFPGVSALLKHQRSEHPNQREMHVCRLCGFSESAPGLLVVHINKKHRKELSGGLCPFRSCKRSFINVKELKEHLNDHWIMKHYACKICGVRYQVLSSLKAHLERHKQDFPNMCEICRLCFRTPGTLLRHKKQRHHFTQPDHS